MKRDRVVSIKAYSSRMDADLAKAVLDANGVRAVVAADDAGGMEPWLGPAQHIQVLVNERDASLARQLLADPPQPSA